MLTIIRAAFAALFVLAVLAGARSRTGGDTSVMAVAGVAAAVAAAGAVLAERWLARGIRPYLVPIIYGALAGWAAAFVIRAAIPMLPLPGLFVEPFYLSVFTLALVYLGIVVAVRAAAAGCVPEFRCGTPTTGTPPTPTPAGRALLLTMLAFLLLLVAASLYLRCSPKNEVYGARHVLVAWAAILAAFVAGYFIRARRPGILVAVLAGLLFGTAMAVETFTVLSVGTLLNHYVRSEFQQAACFVFWYYIGIAFMLQGRPAHPGR